MNRFSILLLSAFSTAHAQFPIALERVAASDNQPAGIVAIDDLRAHLVLDRGPAPTEIALAGYSFSVDFAKPAAPAFGSAYINLRSRPVTQSGAGGGSAWLSNFHFSPSQSFGLVELNPDATVRRWQTGSNSGELIQIAAQMYEVGPDFLRRLDDPHQPLPLCEIQNCEIFDYLGTAQAGYAVRVLSPIQGPKRHELVRFNAQAQITQVLPLVPSGLIRFASLHQNERSALQISLSSDLGSIDLLSVEEGDQAKIVAAASLSSSRLIPIRGRDWLQIVESAQAGQDAVYKLLRLAQADSILGAPAPEQKFTLNVTSGNSFVSVAGSPNGDLVLTTESSLTPNEPSLKHQWLSENGILIASSSNWSAVDFSENGSLFVAETVNINGQRRTQVQLFGPNAQNLHAPRVLENVPMTTAGLRFGQIPEGQLISEQIYPTSTDLGRISELYRHSSSGKSALIARLPPKMALAHSLAPGLTHAFAAGDLHSTVRQIQRINLATGALDSPINVGGTVVSVVPIGAVAFVNVYDPENVKKVYRFDGQTLRALPGLSEAVGTPLHPTAVAHGVNEANQLFEISTEGNMRPSSLSLEGLGQVKILADGSVIAGVAETAALYTAHGPPLPLPSEFILSGQLGNGGYWGTYLSGFREFRVAFLRLANSANPTASLLLGPPASRHTLQLAHLDGDLISIDFLQIVTRFRTYAGGIVRRSIALSPAPQISADTFVWWKLEDVPSGPGITRRSSSLELSQLPVMPAAADVLFEDGWE